jgi:hypothetical protein
MANSSTAHTNLTSMDVKLSSNKLGEGAFRIAYDAGTYIGGSHNNQEAACKSFKNKYQVLETEFFTNDFKVADRAIEYAEEWNKFCEAWEEIRMTRGDVKTINGMKYLVEPLIDYFEKFTSNNGWIANENEVGWAVLATETFSQFTYH